MRPTPEGNADAIYSATATASIAPSVAADASFPAGLALAADAAAAASDATVTIAGVAASIAADCAAATATAYDAASGWQSVRDDCARLIDRTSPFVRPLWSDIPTRPADDWATVKRLLAERGEAEAWAYWTHWYDRLLDPRGQPPDADLWTAIALIDPEIWDAGPDVALPVINGIWAEHRDEADRLAEVLRRSNDGTVIAYEPARDVFVQADVLPDNERRLASAVAKLEVADALVGQYGNLSGILRAERFLIGRAVSIHRANAVMVEYTARQARALLGRSIASGACPTGDEEPVVAVLQSTLLEVELSLADEAEVIEARGAVRDTPLLDAPEAVETLQAAAREIATHAEGPLADQLPENAALVADTSQPPEIRQNAARHLVSAIVQVWTLSRWDKVGAAIVRIDDGTKRVASFVKNVGVIGGAILAVRNSDKIAAAMAEIMKLF